jgi:hypothetical protein
MNRFLGYLDSHRTCINLRQSPQVFLIKRIYYYQEGIIYDPASAITKYQYGFATTSDSYVLLNRRWINPIIQSTPHTYLTDEK